MDEDPYDLDDVFDALREERRRLALRVLSDHETSLTLADLADEVAVRENRASISEVSPEETKRIYLDLYHSHIPRLADLEVVNYHQEGDMVTPTENVGHIVSYLDMVDEYRPVTDPCTG